MAGFEIRVRSLTGFFHGLGDAKEPEWPPSPFRLFQALRAGAASGKRATSEHVRITMQWLERLQPPVIVAPDAVRRASYQLYVPNNDVDSVSGDLSRVSEIKSGKRVTAQQFDADIPVRYLWLDVPSSVPDTLSDLVNGLHTLGKGVDAAYAVLIEGGAIVVPHSRPGVAVWRPDASTQQSVRMAVPVTGTYSSLEKRYAGFLARLKQDRGKVLFSQPGMTRSARVSYGNAPTRMVYALRRRDSPENYYAFPSTQVDSLVKQLQEIVRQTYPDDGELINRYVIGRGASASDIRRRVRFIPLPSRGHEHADGKVRRILVEFPPGSPIRPEAVAYALEGATLPRLLTPHKREDSDSVLKSAATSQPINEVILTAETTSVDGTLERLSYGRESACWRTVSPVVVSPAGWSSETGGTFTGNRRAENERHLHRAVRTAVRQAGYPNPSAICIQTEPFGGHGYRAREYAVGTRFQPVRFVHVELRFPIALRGPVVIGDGRYRGLGLFEAIENVGAGRYAFLVQPSVSLQEANTLLSLCRRALMARCAARTKRRLPTLITGHGSNGEAARSGTHEHLYFAPHLIDEKKVIAIEILLPSVVDRSAGSVSRRDIKLLEEGLEGFDQLRSGRHVLTLAAVEPAPVGRGACWVSVTPYVSTRRPRTPVNLEEFVSQDVLRQLAHLKVIVPESVAVTNARIRNDGLVSAHLRLEFGRVVDGPFLLGKDAHLGGGCLQPVTP